MNILGIDEAGRGCVLGDLVLAGVLVNAKAEQELKNLNLKDSKFYGSGKKAHQQRKNLAKIIRTLCPFFLLAHSAKRVDAYVRNFNLNVLEREMAAEILSQISWDKAVLDGNKIFQPLVKKILEDKKFSKSSNLGEKEHNCSATIFALDYADQQEVAVQAASILAKVERDERLHNLFQGLPERYHSFQEKGGGYGNAGTLAFLQAYALQERALPSFFRTSYQWKNWQAWLKQNQMEFLSSLPLSCV